IMNWWLALIDCERLYSWSIKRFIVQHQTTIAQRSNPDIFRQKLIVAAHVEENRSSS
ncbi:unnamed protein product, partial [Rotaria socialis]